MQKLFELFKEVVILIHNITHRHIALPFPAKHYQKILTELACSIKFWAKCLFCTENVVMVWIEQFLKITYKLILFFKIYNIWMAKVLIVTKVTIYCWCSDGHAFVHIIGSGKTK